MIAIAADSPRSLVVKPRDHPTDLDQDEVGKRLYVLVVDGYQLLYAVDHDGVRRGADSEVPECAGVALPVGVLHLVFEDAEYVELVGVAHRVRTGLCERIEPFGYVAPVVVEDGRKDRIALPRVGNKSVEPALLLHDVVRKDGVVHRVGVAEGVVDLYLLVAPGVVEKRRGKGGLARLGVELFSVGD